MAKEINRKLQIEVSAMEEKQKGDDRFGLVRRGDQGGPKGEQSLDWQSIGGSAWDVQETGQYDRSKKKRCPR